MRLVEKLAKDGLIEAVRARGSLPVWRRDEEAGPLALRITKAGLEAIRVEETEEGISAPEAEPTSGSSPRGRKSAKASTVPAQGSRRPSRVRTRLAASREPSAGQRQGSKQAQVIGLLRRRGGTTVAAIVQATGWQQHSVRGFLAGAVRKRLGLVSEVIEGVRYYRITGAEAESASDKKRRRQAAA